MHRPNFTSPLLVSPLCVALSVLLVGGCFSPPDNGSDEETTTEPGTTSSGAVSDTALDPSSGSTGLGETETTDSAETTGTTVPDSSSSSDSTGPAPAVCGDGVVQADEDCDDGSESADCNADCTESVCGDTVVNAAAGEECDDGQQGTDEDGCDARCSLVVLTRSFRQGAGGYTATRDTWLDENNASTSHSNDDALHCIGTKYQEQVLLRFEQLVGDGDEQIPTGADVVSAQLVLSSTGEEFAGSAAVNSLHEMIVDWDTGDTYNSAVFGGNGIQLGTEAVTEAVEETSGAVSDDGLYEFDVTASVQAWVGGGPNRGWFLWQPSGFDRWFIASSEHLQSQRRPRLVVEFRIQ